MTKKITYLELSMMQNRLANDASVPDLLNLILTEEKFSKFIGTFFLKFRFLTNTFLTFFSLIFLSSDCLTTSTSGNSGI